VVADDFSFAPASVPEPSSLELSILGLLGLGGNLVMNAIRRRNKECARSGVSN
jgi:PEP-CTERM motif